MRELNFLSAQTAENGRNILSAAQFTDDINGSAGTLHRRLTGNVSDRGGKRGISDSHMQHR